MQEFIATLNQELAARVVRVEPQEQNSLVPVRPMVLEAVRAGGSADRDSELHEPTGTGQEINEGQQNLHERRDSQANEVLEPDHDVNRCAQKHGQCQVRVPGPVAVSSHDNPDALNEIRNLS